MIERRAAHPAEPKTIASYVRMSKSLNTLHLRDYVAATMQVKSDISAQAKTLHREYPKGAKRNRRLSGMTS